MIKNKTKQKLLDEIKKIGNVYVSCLKTGVDKANYYRWKKNNKTFRQKANEMERLGRENMCDIAEHSLMKNVKEGKIDAIKYVLSHNSKRYKQNKNSNVVILHKKDIIPQLPQKTLEDLIDENMRKADLTTDTADSKFEMDKPLTMPQENQKIEDISDSGPAIQDKQPDNNT